MGTTKIIRTPTTNAPAETFGRPRSRALSQRCRGHKTAAKTAAKKSALAIGRATTANRIETAARRIKKKRRAG
jgi:hypothetical protein